MDFLDQFVGYDELPSVLDKTFDEVINLRVSHPLLRAMIERAATVVPSGDAMPVLRCLQLTVDRNPDRLRIVGSDVRRTYLASTTNVDVDWNGTAVFEARRLLEIVKAASAELVHIRVVGTKAEVTIGTSSWTMVLMGSEDYPALPVIGDAQFARVGREDLVEALKTVRYAASRDPNQPGLNIIDVSDGKLTAYDRHRFQQVRIDEFPLTMQIPIGVADDLLKLLKGSELEFLQVGQSDTHLLFKIGNDQFITSKLYAKFPDIEAAILRPALENKYRVEVSLDELRHAIKRVRISADEETSAIALNLEPGTLSISARDRFGNTAGDTVGCDWKGPARTLVVNHRYLWDAVDNYGPEAQCTFWVGDDSKTRRAPLMLRHPVTGRTGVVQQMLLDWV